MRKKTISLCYKNSNKQEKKDYFNIFYYFYLPNASADCKKTTLDEKDQTSTSVLNKETVIHKSRRW